VSKQTVDRYAMVEGCDGCPDMRQDGKGSWVDYQDYAAQLTTAHATGKAEGLRAAMDACRTEQVDALRHGCREESLGAKWCRDAIEAMIPAETPAAKVTVTVQEAARVLLRPDAKGMRTDVYDGCEKRVKIHKFDAVLRAIAGGSHGKEEDQKTD
jgi:hypothetical protein